jgi:hypothetical protein
MSQSDLDNLKRRIAELESRVDAKRQTMREANPKSRLRKDDDLQQLKELKQIMEKAKLLKNIA